jgi:shikimate kinase
MWLLAMKGLSGCGKSTLSRALSKQLGWPLIDADTPITKGGIAPYTGCNPPFCDRF